MRNIGFFMHNRGRYFVQQGVKAGGSDTDAPSVPANLAATNITATTLDLSWGPSTDNVGVVSYEVEQAVGAGAFAWLATVAHPTVTLAVSGLTAATEYRFRVRAVDAAGNMSAWGPSDAGLSATTAWAFVAPSTNDGEIFAIIPDGAGGWYIGGNWTSITDSVATYTTGYRRLARLKPDGKIDAAFSCPCSLSVRALALDSTGLYVGGVFNGANSIGTATRNRIARVRPFNDPSPGAVDAWRPDAGSQVEALTLDTANGKLYVGGEMTAMGGTGADFVSTTRNRIARVTTGASATLDAWRPDTNSAPQALALDTANGKLYVGGVHTPMGGTGADFVSTTRNRIARVTTGASATLDAWNPNATGEMKAVTLDLNAGFVYLAGFNMTLVDGVTRNNLARVSSGATATLDAWNPSVTVASGTPSVWRLLIVPGVSQAIAVGNFSAVANHVDSVGNDIAGLDI
jgi:hypothetical protein